MKNVPVFPGFTKPSSDFPSVRSELRAWPNYTEIDLSTARSLTAGTALRLPIPGNMIYIDPKANTGYATIHVQDDASVGNTPITALPGFVVRVPFTELLIENEAQPGQSMRIIYGTDLEFFPNSGAGVSVLNAININDVINTSCQFVNSGGPTTVGSNQVTTMLAPSANPRGIILRNGHQVLTAGASGWIIQYVFASLTAPTTTGAAKADAHCILFDQNFTTTPAIARTGFTQRRIPAGWGVYIINNVGVAVAGQASVQLSLEIL